MGRAFYDTAMQASQEPLLTKGLSGKFSNISESIPGVDDEENKAMYEGPEGLASQISLADGGLNGEIDSICARCSNPRPPIEAAEADKDVWLQCESCEKWSHAVCVQDLLQKKGITDLSDKALEDFHFVCCGDD